LVKKLNLPWCRTDRMCLIWQSCRSVST